MSSPSGGRPSCRQASGGRCIWPSGQILGTPPPGQRQCQIPHPRLARGQADGGYRLANRLQNVQRLVDVLNRLDENKTVQWRALELPFILVHHRPVGRVLALSTASHRRYWPRGSCKSDGPSKSPPASLVETGPRGMVSFRASSSTASISAKRAGLRLPFSST